MLYIYLMSSTETQASEPRYTVRLATDLPRTYSVIDHKTGQSVSTHSDILKAIKEAERQERYNG